ncbi:MAG: hypothetical protein VYE15_01140 [Myxococcota bacterium]|nr:hypothetical protein [Myxococcota bacterium]
MRHLLIILSLVSLVGSGCEEGVLTRDEARSALNETSLSTQVYGLATLVASSLQSQQASTEEELASDLRSWWAQQLDCGTVAGEGTGVSVVFDEQGCDWLQRTWTGEIALEVTGTSAQQHQLSGTFTQVSTGILAVSGSVSVTWSREANTGTIVHSLTWSDGTNGRVSEGECVLTLEEDGGVVTLNGERSWDGDTGPWTLTLEGTAVRGADPVPETGRYKVESPVAGPLDLDFQRGGEDTLSVSVTGMGQAYSFTVVTPKGP